MQSDYDSRKATDYTVAAQQRILNVATVMFGHEIDGLTPGQVARLADISATSATRDLSNLKTAGWAEQLPNGNWRISPMLGRKAMGVLAALERAAQKLDELRQRYTRTA